MGKLDRVLKFGNLANIPLTVIVFFAGAAWLVGWPKDQHFTVNSQMILVAILLLVGAASVTVQIVDRARSSSPSITRQGNMNPAQTNVANLTVVQVEELYRIFDGPMLQETEANIRIQASLVEPTERENYLSRTLTMLMVLSIYEMAWINIFGSQLRALNQLNTRMLTHQELRHFYNEGLASLPQIYLNRPFELWLAFLRTSVLVRDEGNRIQITVRGRELLRYVVQNGYDQNAKLG